MKKIAHLLGLNAAASWTGNTTQAGREKNRRAIAVIMQTRTVTE